MIIKAGPYGQVLFMDSIELLPVEHDQLASNWMTKSFDYEEEQSVIQCWPNAGAHSWGMRTLDGLPCSTCDCEVKYDKADDGTLMVIHAQEPALSTG